MAKETPENATETSKKPEKAPFTLKPSRQTCALLGGLTGFVLFVSIGLFAWQSAAVAQVEAQVRKKNEEVDNANKIANQLTEVQTEYARVEQKLRYLETSISPGDYVPTLLKQMETLANQMDLGWPNGTYNVEPAPDPPTDKEKRKTFKPWPYDKFHIDMEVTGAYWNVARLLHRFTTFEKIIAVENLQITPINTDNKYSKSVNAKLTLTGFVFKDDQNTARPEAEKAASASTPNPTTRGV
ncbi:MAG: type 4a pilus biogenesis protein PilO [Capsulimonadales bacterium]|nr:type 4a pilus biogenesis protein PilO [Capsulimonadales bacterium]